jgi:hypothetical protein
LEVVRWLKALLSIIGESSDDSNQAGGQQAAGLLLLVNGVAFQDPGTPRMAGDFD